MPQRVAIHVHGRVQGVNFRASARREARRLGLSGFARNEPDGSVAIEVDGSAESVAAFVEWCRQGPSAARVERVEVAEAEPRGGEGFAIG
jgi:acylphosphatase